MKRNPEKDFVYCRHLLDDFLKVYVAEKERAEKYKSLVQELAAGLQGLIDGTPTTIMRGGKPRGAGRNMRWIKRWGC